MRVGWDKGSNLVKDVNIVCMPRGFDPRYLAFGFGKVALDTQRDDVSPPGCKFPGPMQKSV